MTLGSGIALAGMWLAVAVVSVMVPDAAPPALTFAFVGSFFIGMR